MLVLEGRDVGLVTEIPKMAYVQAVEGGVLSFGCFQSAWPGRFFGHKTRKASLLQALERHNCCNTDSPKPTLPINKLLSHVSISTNTCTKLQNLK